MAVVLVPDNRTGVQRCIGVGIARDIVRAGIESNSPLAGRGFVAAGLGRPVV